MSGDREPGEKTTSECEEDVDPFENELEYTTWEKFKLFLGLVTLCPIRCVLLALDTLVAHILGLAILMFTEWRHSKTTSSAPYSSTLRTVQNYYGWFFGYISFIIAGVWVTVKGKRASRQEAPIIITAPHTSFVDSLLVLFCSCSALERIEDKNNFGLWPTLLVMQNFFVDRSSQDSRQKAQDMIVNRVTSDKPWPQILIFPEGFVGNGKVLLRFNKGCLAAGQPVQPLALRYHLLPGRNYVTWPNKKHHPLKILCYILATLYTRLDIEFLPVYTPSEAEKRDPVLYADNLQKVFSNHLGIPASQKTKNQKTK